jgi:hypothetical protein
MDSCRSVGLVAALTLLAGCGGGGGSTPVVVVPTGPRVVAASAGADLTAANYAATSAPLVRAVLNAAGNQLLDVTGGTRESPQSARTGDAVVRLAASPAFLVRWVLGQVPRAARERPAAVSSESVDCPYGGSMLLTFDDADNDQQVSAGDTLSILATACVAEFGLPPVDGGFSMTVNVVELDSQGAAVALDVSGAFTQFTVQGYGSMDGAFRVWSKPESASTEHLRVRYLKTTVTEVTGTVVYDLDVDALNTATGGSLELSGGIGLGGQVYAVTPVTRFDYTTGQAPASGVLRLGDGVGDSVQLNAVDAVQLQLAFFLAGSSTPAATSGPLLWDDYRD